MIVAVDASALVAIALGEPEARAFDALLSSATEAYMTPINITETGLALVLRNGRFRQDQFSEWLTAQRVIERHLDGDLALAAYLRYGRGVHRAGLNLGDCFAYGLAKQLDIPLLYKGDDFVFTDVRPALQPT
jgi:ribonuclease VapC